MSISYIQVKVKLFHQQSKVVEDATDLLGERCLTVTLNAAPQNNEANTALIEVLADYLNTSKQRITIVKGHQSRLKKIAVQC